MGKNKRKPAKKSKRVNNKQNAKLIKLFSVTLTGVVFVGIACIFFFKWADKATDEIAKREKSAYSHFVLTKEVIPENASEEELAKAYEAAVDQMRDENGRYSDQIADEDYLIANNIYVKEAKDPEGGMVSVTFAGDILFDENYSVMAALVGNGGNIVNGIDSKLIDIMSDSDIMMINNEFPYSNRGTPTANKTFTFRAKPETVNYLCDMDVDVVSLANNHAYDYGEEAFIDTMDTLSSAGIAYVGAGRNIDEASSAVFYIVNNMKIGILSATQIEKGDYPDTKGATDSSPGVFRCWNNDRLLKKISEVKEECDYLIVYIHWGTESETEPDWAQIEQAPEMATAGADLIIGDHPHVLQPISVVKGVPVVYSLGNFWFNSKELDTCMIQATFSRDGIDSLRLIPALQSGCKTKLLDGEEAERLIGSMRAMSPNVKIDDEGYITYK